MTTIPSDPSQRATWALRPATTDDVEYISRRWHGYFGSVREEAASFVRDILVGEHDGCVLVACADGQRVGCAVAEANDADAIAEHCLGHPELVPTDGSAGFLNFACVAPGYRGRGIHSAMVRTRVLSLASDVDRFHTISWVREDQLV